MPNLSHGDSRLATDFRVADNARMFACGGDMSGEKEQWIIFLNFSWED